MFNKNMSLRIAKHHQTPRNSTPRLTGQFSRLGRMNTPKFVSGSDRIAPLNGKLLRTTYTNWIIKWEDTRSGKLKQM